ncbi:MAG: AAA family ATPase [Bacteroidales bacterium]|nr:AAA family ATPase [Bacteroidales bacterium]MCF8458312.1 AAA family ATPase [Bacteroidales bacterium]
MTTKEIFIKSITVNKVRHLKDFTIPISDTERKHLILTGRNGSGKTSLLEALRNYLTLIPNRDIFEIQNWKTNLDDYTNRFNEIEDRLLGLDSDSERVKLRREQDILSRDINAYKSKVDHFLCIAINFQNLADIVLLFKEGNFITSYFESKRGTIFSVPVGINKIEFKSSYTIEDKVNHEFIQYLVNLKAQRSFARDDNKIEKVHSIDNYFNMLENFLQYIFDDNDLKLEFNNEKYEFKIIQKEREEFDLNSLADGYSAIMNIITELILRMEKTKTKNYDVQGIVLIDEIETHLHIELQKKILPFLTTVFPKIQFIVTTHSPFVLSSLPNAVIYDLENHLLVEDLSGYSVDGIIEGYFNADKYSIELKKQVAEYESLLKNEKRDIVEEDRVDYLTKHFNDLSKFMAPELQLKLQQLQLQKL